MAKVESLGNLVSVITKNSKFMIFDNNNVLTNAGLNNPNKINITENGTYYLVNNLDSNYSNSDIDIELVINEGINASIVELIKTEKDITLSRGVNLKENSELNIITIYESSTNKTVIKAKTVLEKGAYLNSKSLSLFMGEVESLYDENLTGEKAKIEGYNVFINNSKTKQNFDLNTYHNVKETESMVRNFAICKGESVLNINTNGIVLNGSKQSNISQKTKGILLSQESGISANPLLQIDEFDCLASHGAGIGAIDEEDLFYLMSRGLTKLESEKLIIGGFVNPIYEAISNEDLRNIILNKVSKYL